MYKNESKMMADNNKSFSVLFIRTMKRRKISIPKIQTGNVMPMEKRNFNAKKILNCIKSKLHLSGCTYSLMITVNTKSPGLLPQSVTQQNIFFYIMR